MAFALRESLPLLEEAVQAAGMTWNKGPSQWPCYRITFANTSSSGAASNGETTLKPSSCPEGRPSARILSIPHYNNPKVDRLLCARNGFPAPHPLELLQQAAKLSEELGGDCLQFDWAGPVGNPPSAWAKASGLSHDWTCLRASSARAVLR